MSMRKIKVTMGSDLYNNTGANIDLYFGDTVLESNLAIEQTGMVREYTVDVENGTYDLKFVYNNDEADDFDNNGVFESDRNFIVENLEIANDGEIFEQYAVSGTTLDSFSLTFINGTPEDPEAKVWSYPLRMWIGGIAIVPVTFA